MRRRFGEAEIWRFGDLEIRRFGDSEMGGRKIESPNLQSPISNLQSPISPLQEATACATNWQPIETC
ncbi:MAG: hypothetical protein D6796_05050 [Caldilineae bacterium]|nr:MAG: hypothetical protein D6796_05050 [Caldilineae bacterium]